MHTSKITNGKALSYASLSAEELSRSAQSESVGRTYANITAEQLFGAHGAKASAIQASEIRLLHPVRYRELKREYAESIGELKKALPADIDATVEV